MQRDPLDRLLEQAFLYDDPSAYRAGVQAAWREMSRMSEAVRQPAPLAGSAGAAAADLTGERPEAAAG